MNMLDLHTTAGAETWGDVAGRRFVARYASPPERADARAAWRAVCDAPTSAEVFEAFARAFMGRAAAELAAELAHVMTEHSAEERAELERGVMDTLHASREGRLVGQQEAARQALRASIRYGLDTYARQAAERLCEVQGALDAAHGLRPLRAFLFEAFGGDA